LLGASVAADDKKGRNALPSAKETSQVGPHKTVAWQLNYIPIDSKGKAVPLQAWSGPEGSRKLRFPDYMKTAQDDGKVVSLTHRPPLPPENAPGIHFC
jgi:hypothetical protein